MSSDSLPDGRLFSIFETSDADILCEQCMNDLVSWGFDSFQCRQKTQRILENARKAADETPRPFESVSADGVTQIDYKWYWGLPPLARATMRFLDEEIRSDMFFRCHARNICMEDLELDLARSLPTFSNDSTAADADAPLPSELRRRFYAFIAQIRTIEEAWTEWSDQTAKATSMNALVREMIANGSM